MQQFLRNRSLLILCAVVAFTCLVLIINTLEFAIPAFSLDFQSNLDSSQINQIVHKYQSKYQSQSQSCASKDQPVVQCTFEKERSETFAFLTNIDIPKRPVFSFLESWMKPDYVISIHTYSHLIGYKLYFHLLNE